MPIADGKNYYNEAGGDAPSDAIKSVVIESSEIVHHGTMKAGSKITYPTFGTWEKATASPVMFNNTITRATTTTTTTWQKRQNCINKLKTLSQQHVTDKRQQMTVDDEEQQLDSKPVVSDDCSETVASILSPAYETFSAIAGIHSKKSQGRDKKPIPLYQFVSDIFKNVSKSASCVRSMNPVTACAPLGGNHNHYQQDQFKAEMEEDFDASTFDSIMDGMSAHRNVEFSAVYQEDEATFDDSLATSYNDPYY